MSYVKSLVFSLGLYIIDDCKIKAKNLYFDSLSSLGLCVKYDKFSKIIAFLIFSSSMGTLLVLYYY